LGNRRDVILKAIKLRKNPSASHILLRKLIRRNFSIKEFEEYVELNIQGQPNLINFYKESSQLAISIGEETQKNIHGELTHFIVSSDSLKKSDINEFFLHIEDVDHTINRNISEVKEYPQTKIISETEIFEADEILHKNASNEQSNLSEIIGHPPGWLLRSGISLLAIITCLLLGLSHLIQYPDKLTAVGYVTTEKPPLILVAPSTAVIEDLLVQTGDTVAEKEPLLYFKNTAILSDIVQLKDWIDHVDRDEFPKLSSELSLGVLQNQYAQLLLVLDEYHEVRAQQSATSQIITIQDELNNINKLNASLIVEQQHYDNEHQLAIKELERNQNLYREEIISQRELEQSERQYEQFVRQLQVLKKSKVQNEIRQDQLTLEGKKIREQRASELMGYRFKINQQITGLDANIREWEDENFIRADRSGMIEWKPNIVEKITLQGGEELGYIIPDNSDNLKIIKSKVSVAGVGKISKGSKCIVRFDAYPYKDYGTVIEALGQIALLPEFTEQGAIYDLSIYMPDVMITDYGHMIPYRPQMSVSIDIITESRSILERIFNQFLNLLKH